MAEGGLLSVKGHRQMVALLFLQDLEHNIQKSIHCIGMDSFGIGEIRHPVKSPVQDAVAVD